MLHAYSLGRTDSCGLAVMGEDLLLFSGDDCTTLTKLSAGTMQQTASVQLDTVIQPADPAVRVSSRGVTYYDEAQHALVFLDASLREVRRVALPGDIIGSPALSADRQTLYYCTADSLYARSLESGISRLLRQMQYPVQMPAGLHCGDSILECRVQDAYGDDSVLFLSTDDGATLHEAAPDTALWSFEGSYLALSRDGAYTQILTGLRGQETKQLCADSYGAAIHPLLPFYTVLATEGPEGIALGCYDLRSGLRTSEAQLPDAAHAPEHFVLSPDGKSICFLRYSGSLKSDTVVFWAFTEAPSADETVYLTAPRTADAPDEPGLDDCAAQAESLAEAYGVRIQLWRDAAGMAPDGYTFEAEYQVPLIRRALDALDEALSVYPEGLLKRAAAGTDSRRITISLVRSITGQPDAPRPGIHDGLEYRDDDGNACIAVTPGEQMTGSVYHALFHILDSRILTLCSAYDGWNALNPPDFAYDLDYAANDLRADTRYLSGNDRAFIDRHSMSFPREDRARIMEYAMMPGNEDIFRTDAMQQKLRTLCLGIREAFKLQKSEESFLWEQYLTEPLAAT